MRGIAQLHHYRAAVLQPCAMNLADAGGRECDGFDVGDLPALGGRPLRRQQRLDFFKRQRLDLALQQLELLRQRRRQHIAAAS